MAAIAELGHVGIHVFDLEKETQFYQDVLGLTVTDRSESLGMVFLSARPEVEHHELLLCRGRSADRGAMMLQQISFRCPSLEDVVEFYHRLKAANVPIDMVVSHGNAVGVYFYDPEGNRVEVYVPTGLKAAQPYLQSIDLTQPPDQVMAQIEESVRQNRHGSYVEPALAAQQNLF